MLVGEVFARMGLDSKQYEKDLNRLEGETKKRATTLGSMFKGAFSVALGMGVFEAIQRGIHATVGQAISFNSMMEQAQIGFATLLGSAEKAQTFLDEMARFASRTPFEYPELLEAARRMMAMGFAAEEVLPTLEAVGNAAAGLGVGKEGIDRITLALGQMRAKGRVSAEEMMQLTEAGVPAWELLAEAMEKSISEVRDLSEKGLIPADKAVQQLIEGMGKRFPDMMKNMEDTWQGVTSTIRDVWRMTIGALTNNLFKGLVSWLQGVRDWATEFYNTFRQFGLQAALTKSFGPEFAATVNMAVSALKEFWNTAKTVLGTIARYWVVIKPIVLSALAAFLSFRLVNWVFGLAAKAVAQFTFVTAAMRGEAVATSGILNFVARAVQIYQLQLKLASMAGTQHIGILQALRIALYSVWAAMGPLGWAIMGVSAAVTGGIIAWSKYAAIVEKANLQKVLQSVSGQNANVADSSQQAAEGMEEEAEATKEAGKAAAKNIQSFDEVHQLMEDTAGAAEDVTVGLDQVAVPTLEDPGAIGAPDIDMEAAIEQVKPTLAGFWQWIKQGAANLWETVKQKWSEFVNWVKSWDVWDWLGQKWQDLKGLTGTIWAGITDVVSTAWAGVANVTATVWQEIWILLQTYWNNLVNLVSSIFTAIANYILGTWNNIKNTTLSIWGAIWGFLQSQWEDIKNFGISVFAILADFITGKIDLRTAARLIWEEIGTFLNNTWNNIKTLGEGIWGALAGFITTQWQLVRDLTVNIWTAIKDFVLGNWEATKQAVINIWTVIKDFLGSTWDSIKTAATNTWTAILDFLGINWEETKRKAAELWGNIEQTIIDRWNELRNTVGPTWENIKTAIVEKWKEIKEDAFEWGKNLIQGFIDGIKQKFNDLKSNISNIGSTIKDLLSGGSSGAGTKAGGGGGGGGGSTLADQKQAAKEYYVANKDAIDAIAREKGVDLGVAADMLKFGTVPKLATGTNYVPEDMLAFLHEGEAVVPKAYNPAAGGGLTAEQIEQAVYRAFVSAMRIVQASTQQGDSREIVLKIDNTVLARVQLPALSKEAQRQGFDLLVRPQGV